MKTSRTTYEVAVQLSAAVQLSLSAFAFRGLTAEASRARGMSDWRSARESRYWDARRRNRPALVTWVKLECPAKALRRPVAMQSAALCGVFSRRRRLAPLSSPRRSSHGELAWGMMRPSLANVCRRASLAPASTRVCAYSQTTCRPGRPASLKAHASSIIDKQQEHFEGVLGAPF